MKTITDAANITGVNRRRIQEYEKAGIAIQPSQWNKYGYGVYSDEMLDRLWQIRFYMEAGYSKAKMEEIFSNPSYDFCETLNEQIELLVKKRAEIDDLISVARLMKEAILSPGTIQNQALGLEKADYKESVSFWGALSRAFDGIATEDCPMSDEVANLTVQRLDAVIRLHTSGMSPDDPIVQAAVDALHKAAQPWLSESCLAVFAVSLLIAPGSEVAREIDIEYGYGAAEFLYGAIQAHVGKGITTGTDKDILDAFEAIIALGKRKFKASSDEVQHEVEILSTCYDSLLGINVRSTLPEMAKLFLDPSYYQVFDRQVRTKGAGRYIGKAISVYCDKNLNLDKLKEA